MKSSEVGELWVCCSIFKAEKGLFVEYNLFLGSFTIKKIAKNKKERNLDYNFV